MTTPSSDSERLDLLSNQVANLQENVNSMSGRLAALESTAEDQGRQLEDLKGQVGGVQNKVDELQGTVVRQGERLIAVEVRLTEVKESIDLLVGRMASLEQRMTLFYLSTLGAFVAGLVLVVINNILT